MKTRWQKRQTASESGVFPKPDLSVFAPQEAAESPDSPEMPDPGSITGVLPVVSEGEDAAKDQDDSAAGKRG